MSPDRYIPDGRRIFHRVAPEQTAPYTARGGRRFAVEESALMADRAGPACNLCTYAAHLAKVHG